MLEVLALALLLSVFGGTVSHILMTQIGASSSIGGSVKGMQASRLRRVAKPSEDEAPGPTWASFPRAF
jgi:hypothetical protein